MQGRSYGFEKRGSNLEEIPPEGPVRFRRAVGMMIYAKPIRLTLIPSVEDGVWLYDNQQVEEMRARRELWNHASFIAVGG